MAVLLHSLCRNNIIHVLFFIMIPNLLTYLCLFELKQQHLNWKQQIWRAVVGSYSRKTCFANVSKKRTAHIILQNFISKRGLNFAHYFPCWMRETSCANACWWFPKWASTMSSISGKRSSGPRPVALKTHSLNGIILCKHMMICQSGSFELKSKYNRQNHPWRPERPMMLLWYLPVHNAPSLDCCNIKLAIFPEPNPEIIFVEVFLERSCCFTPDLCPTNAAYIVTI